MDFLDPKKKRAYKIRLYLGYGLMTLLILGFTFFIGLMSFGFNLDPRTGDVFQNGLIFVDAHPESARVLINGTEKARTDTRLVLPGGDYKLELQRDGYRSWSQNIKVVGGSVERYVYPFLFPEVLQPENIQAYSAPPRFASQSPDRKWLVAGQAADLNAFEVTDLSTEDPEPIVVKIPDTVLNQTGTKHVIEAIEWSTDNRHLLLKHTYDGGMEYIMFDRQNQAPPINLTSYFSVPFTDIKLRDKKFNQFYLHNAPAGTLSTATLVNKQVIELVTGVVDFQPHGSDMLLYVKKHPELKDKVQVIIRDGDTNYTLRDLPLDSNYLLDMARFDGKWYVATGASQEKQAYIYINPLDDIRQDTSEPAAPKVLLLLDDPIQYLSFSSNARFIAVQAGSKFAVYDAETGRKFRYDTKLTLTAGYKALWMDGHRITVVSENKLIVFDFNGTNMQKLNDVNAAYNPFFDRDYVNLFTIGPSVSDKAKTALTRISIKIEPNN